MQIRGNFDFHMHCADLIVYVEAQRKKSGEWRLDKSDSAYYEKEEKKLRKERNILQEVNTIMTNYPFE